MALGAARGLTGKAQMRVVFRVQFNACSLFVGGPSSWVVHALVSFRLYNDSSVLVFLFIMKNIQPLVVLEVTYGHVVKLTEETRSGKNTARTDSQSSVSRQKE